MDLTGSCFISIDVPQTFFHSDREVLFFLLDLHGDFLELKLAGIMYT